MVGRKLNCTYSNVVCGNAGSTPGLGGGDVDLVAPFPSPLFIHSKLMKPNLYL
jgi:hypothetical protein